jgi:hypothetical protein
VLKEQQWQAWPLAETAICLTSSVDVEEKRRRGNVAPCAHGPTIPLETEHIS